MIVDLRTYTYLPSKFHKFLKGYEEIGYALTTKHLGTTLGVFRSDSGVMNRTFQFFLYEDHDHRDKCRKAMLADPAWYDYIKIDGEAVLNQSNVLYRPTAFSPLQNTAFTFPPAESLRLFELTIWNIRPDALHDAVDLLADRGAAVTRRHSPGIIAYLTSETGPEGQIVRLTAYDDATSWEKSRQSAENDQEYADFARSFRGFLQASDTTLVIPVPYSLLR